MLSELLYTSAIFKWSGIAPNSDKYLMKCVHRCLKLRFHIHGTRQTNATTNVKAGVNTRWCLHMSGFECECGKQIAPHTDQCECEHERNRANGNFDPVSQIWSKKTCHIRIAHMWNLGLSRVCRIKYRSVLGLEKLDVFIELSSVTTCLLLLCVEQPPKLHYGGSKY